MFDDWLLFLVLGYVNFDFKCLFNEYISYKFINRRRGKFIFI